MYNATNAATWLRAPQRFATRLRVLRRASIQRKDLFVNLSSRLGSTRRNSACLIAPQCNSTICLSIYYRTAALRSAPPCIVSLLGSSPCVAPQHVATLLNDLFVNLSSLRAAALLDFPQRYALLLNDLFVAPQRYVLQRSPSRFNSIQRFVCQFITAPRHGSRQRTAAQLGLPRRAATQRNDLFVNLSSQRSALQHGSSPLDATQRFVCQFIGSPKRNSALSCAPHINATN